MEVSEQELIIMENAMVAAREYLAGDDSQRSQSIKQQLVEAEQVAGAKLGSSEGVTGPGAMGGSASEKLIIDSIDILSKEDKVKELFQSFGLKKRIG